MNEHKMSQEEASELLLSTLKAAKKPLTTRELEGQIRKHLASCPDSVAVLLNKLRLRGLIKGKLSAERKGWVWWIES